MREVTAIAAETRAGAGKGIARSTRRSGRVPAVIYGNKAEPENISLDSYTLEREVHKGGFLNRLFDLEIDGKKQRVLPRDLQFHPVTDRAIHVDFLRIGKNARIRLFVPVVFTDMDQSPGVKKGGVLNVVRHEVEFYCPAEHIPENISISLAGLDIGTSIHISAFKLPDDIKPVISDRDFTVATIAAPSVLTDVEDKPAAVTAAEGAAAAEAAGAAGGGDAKGAAPAAGGKAPAAGAKAPAGGAAKAPAAKAPAGKK